jgi:hypothetical protein
MKTTFVTTMAVLFLLLNSTILQAQTTEPKINQVESLKQFEGQWRYELKKDSGEYWDAKLLGKALVFTVYSEIKGKKNLMYQSSFGHDSKTGKIMGFVLFPNADYKTWIGSFIKEETLAVDMVDNFNPEKVSINCEFQFDTPDLLTVTCFNKGERIGLKKFNRIK